MNLQCERISPETEKWKRMMSGKKNYQHFPALTGFSMAVSGFSWDHVRAKNWDLAVEAFRIVG